MPSRYIACWDSRKLLPIVPIRSKEQCTWNWSCQHRIRQRLKPVEFVLRSRDPPPTKEPLACARGSGGRLGPCGPCRYLGGACCCWFAGAGGAGFGDSCSRLFFSGVAISSSASLAFLLSTL